MTTFLFCLFLFWGVGWACRKSLPVGQAQPTCCGAPGSPRSVVQPPIAAPPSHPRGNTATPLGRPRNVITPPPRRHDEIVDEIVGWWDTTEARNIFAPTSPVGGTEIVVMLRIELLDSPINNPRKLEKVVNKATECKLEDKYAVEIVYKCLYLR